MLDKNKVKILSIVSFLLVLSLCQPAQAYAWSWGGSHRGDDRDHDRDRGRDRDRGHDRGWGYPHYQRYPYGRLEVKLPGGFIEFGFGGHKYFYHGGLFYRQSAREYVVVPPPSGVIIYAIPAGYHQVVIDGVLYYTYNGIYYTRVNTGYQVVQPPPTVVVDPATVASNDIPEGAPGEFTVNIPNSKGGYCAVTVTRTERGYAGPQGEFYAAFPKVEQLRAMYCQS